MAPPQTPKHPNTGESTASRFSPASDEDPMGDVERAVKLEDEETPSQPLIMPSPHTRSEDPGASATADDGIARHRKLSCASLDAAMGQLYVKLDLVANNDVAAVKSDAGVWIGRMHEAFLQPYSEDPVGSFADDAESQKKKKGAVTGQWKAWQERSQKAVEELMQAHPDPKERELCFWLLYHEVMRLYDEGYRRGTEKLEQELKCSERMDLIISAIQDYSIVRLRVLKQKELYQFAVAPAHYTRSKIMSVQSNTTRGKIASAKDAAVQASDHSREKVTIDMTDESADPVVIKEELG